MKRAQELSQFSPFCSFSRLLPPHLPCFLLTAQVLAQASIAVLHAWGLDVLSVVCSGMDLMPMGDLRGLWVTSLSPHHPYGLAGDSLPGKYLPLGYFFYLENVAKCSFFLFFLAVGSVV